MGNENLKCIHCNHDVSLSGHQVELDGRALEGGGCLSIEWDETCPNCGKNFTIDVSVGPVDVSIRAVRQKAESAGSDFAQYVTGC